MIRFSLSNKAEAAVDFKCLKRLSFCERLKLCEVLRHVLTVTAQSSFLSCHAIRSLFRFMFALTSTMLSVTFVLYHLAKDNFNVTVAEALAESIYDEDGCEI